MKTWHFESFQAQPNESYNVSQTDYYGKRSHDLFVHFEVALSHTHNVVMQSV